MEMPERRYVSGDYRYGFNGQEGDDEHLGSGNSYAFRYRIHDARLGRFLSVDPLEAEYSWNSTYAFAENRVIQGIDLEGAEYGNSVIFYPKALRLGLITQGYVHEVARVKNYRIWGVYTDKRGHTKPQYLLAVQDNAQLFQKKRQF